MDEEAMLAVINRQGAQITNLQTRCEQLTRTLRERNEELQRLEHACRSATGLLADIQSFVRAARDVVEAAAGVQALEEDAS